MIQEGEEARLYLQDVEQRLAAHIQMVPEMHITPLLVSSVDIGEALVPRKNVPQNGPLDSSLCISYYRLIESGIERREG